MRELRNAVERAWLLAEDGQLELKPTLDGLLSLDPVPDNTDQLSIRIGQTLEEVERTVIQATLSYHGGSKPKAAQTLGCSLKTLYNKLNSYSQVATAAGI